MSATPVHAQNSEDGWLKRNWDNMIARYNIYFNAQLKFQSATSDLYAKQVDDFETFLEVYPYGTPEDAKQLRAPMEEVMKKSSKVIQHRPRSKWVDDAYFLIGQTHFFRNDPFAAIEVFQFVYNKFPDPEMKAKAQLWIMKSYIRQGKYNDAEGVLSLIRETEITDKRTEAAVHLVAGDLFVKQGKYGLAIDELTEGLKNTKDRQLRYRTHFLLGQLYLETKKFEEANAHFVRVLKAQCSLRIRFSGQSGIDPSNGRIRRKRTQVNQAESEEDVEG